MMIDMDMELWMENKIQDWEEIVSEIRDMQNSTKLDRMQQLALYLWLKDHWPNNCWIYHSIVCQTDGNATGGVVMQPVKMGGHMRSGPCVCSPRGVSIRLERREQVGWVEERGTCIASKLLDRRGVRRGGGGCRGWWGKSLSCIGLLSHSRTSSTLLLPLEMLL